MRNTNQTIVFSNLSRIEFTKQDSADLKTLVYQDEYGLTSTYICNHVLQCENLWFNSSCVYVSQIDQSVCRCLPGFRFTDQGRDSCKMFNCTSDAQCQKWGGFKVCDKSGVCLCPYDYYQDDNHDCLRYAIMYEKSFPMTMLLLMMIVPGIALLTSCFIKLGLYKICSHD